MSNTSALINAYFDTFNRRDVEGRLALMTEDVLHDLNEGDTQIGKESFRAFIDYMDARYRETIVDLVVMENGDRGAAEFRVHGVYTQTDVGLPEATGQTYDIPAAAFFTIRDGKIARVTSYYNLRNWIAAVSVP